MSLRSSRRRQDRFRPGAGRGARAPVARVSLTGVKTPAGILGVARPAPDAAPGRLVDALRQLGPLSGHAGDNPLVVLGELDRLGEEAADALLGALDPARNHSFRDRYVGLPLDLTGVLFVAVAADPARIPPLLQERLELLPLAGFTDAEKQHIATRHLIPQRRRHHGLSADELSFSPAALQFLVGGYSHEPGVRLFDDGIAALCRRAARLRAEGLPLPGEMRPEALSAWLRAPRFRNEEIAGRIRRPGVALGLAVTGEGADVLLVEAACVGSRVGARRPVHQGSASSPRGRHYIRARSRRRSSSRSSARRRRLPHSPAAPRARHRPQAISHGGRRRRVLRSKRAGCPAPMS